MCTDVLIKKKSITGLNPPKLLTTISQRAKRLVRFCATHLPVHGFEMVLGQRENQQRRHASQF